MSYGGGVMPKVLDLKTKKFIDLPDAMASGDEAGALKTAIQCNAYLLDSLKDITTKLEEVTEKLAKSDYRAQEAEERAERAEERAEKADGRSKSAEERAEQSASRHEAMEKTWSTELTKSISGLNAAVSGFQGSLSKMSTDVAALLAKSGSGKAAPAIDMAALTKALRAEFERLQPQQQGPLDTTVVERDANGYVRRFITKPIDS